MDKQKIISKLEQALKTHDTDIHFTVNEVKHLKMLMQHNIKGSGVSLCKNCKTTNILRMISDSCHSCMSVEMEKEKKLKEQNENTKSTKY